MFRVSRKLCKTHPRKIPPDNDSRKVVDEFGNISAGSLSYLETTLKTSLENLNPYRLHKMFVKIKFTDIIDILKVKLIINSL